MGDRPDLETLPKNSATYKAVHRLAGTEGGIVRSETSESQGRRRRGDVGGILRGTRARPVAGRGQAELSRIGERFPVQGGPPADSTDAGRSGRQTFWAPDGRIGGGLGGRWRCRLGGVSLAVPSVGQRLHRTESTAPSGSKANASPQRGASRLLPRELRGGSKKVRWRGCGLDCDAASPMPPQDKEGQDAGIDTVCERRLRIPGGQASPATSRSAVAVTKRGHAAAVTGRRSRSSGHGARPVRMSSIEYPGGGAFCDRPGGDHPAGLAGIAASSAHRPLQHPGLSMERPGRFHPASAPHRGHSPSASLWRAASSPGRLFS